MSEVVAGWLSLALIALSLLLLANSFFTLYVRKRGSRTSEVITWISAACVLGYWSWRLLT